MDCQNNALIYPGAGAALRKASGSTGNAVSELLDIPNNGYSEVFSGNDCIEWALLFLFAAAATGDVVIEEVADRSATAGGEELDTVSVVAELVGRFNSGGMRTGYFRIHNTSGQALTAYLQKRISAADYETRFGTVEAAITAKVSDAAYGPGWNGDATHAPSKNAVYDKIASLVGLDQAAIQALIDASISGQTIVTKSANFTLAAEDSGTLFLVDSFPNIIAPTGLPIGFVFEIFGIDGSTYRFFVDSYDRGDGFNALGLPSGNEVFSGSSGSTMHAAEWDLTGAMCNSFVRVMKATDTQWITSLAGQWVDF